MNFLTLCLAGYFFALLGFYAHPSGIKRWALWVCLGLALFVVSSMRPGVYSDPLALQAALENEKNVRILVGAFAAFVCGLRAKNAGYKWWLAGLAGLPLISLPLVVFLLFSDGTLKTSRRSKESREE